MATRTPVKINVGSSFIVDRNTDDIFAIICEMYDSLTLALTEKWETLTKVVFITGVLANSDEISFLKKLYHLIARKFASGSSLKMTLYFHVVEGGLVTNKSRVDADNVTRQRLVERYKMTDEESPNLTIIDVDLSEMYPQYILEEDRCLLMFAPVSMTVVFDYVDGRYGILVAFPGYNLNFKLPCDGGLSDKYTEFSKSEIEYRCEELLNRFKR